MAGRMRFASISERWVESLHALNAKALSRATHTGALHVVYHGTLRPLRGPFATRPDAVRELADCARR
eukprot:12870051-Alexandrium_andersonii.AAC.1